MQATIELPKAFSVRDDRELPVIQDLVARLHPMLLVAQVATGVHVDGGYTSIGALSTWTASRSPRRMWRPR
jgi:hypothetical protein